MKHLLTLLTIFNSLSLAFAVTNKMDIPVYRIRHNSSYDDFCKRNPGECDLSGPQEIVLTDTTWELLNSVNLAVNNEITFMLDNDYYDLEEFWTYPSEGIGDCDDYALEKRRRLVEEGLPRGALRMIVAFHRTKFYGHALLSVETDKGTFILDNEVPEILLWHKKPFIYEGRELPDGRFERFEQNWLETSY